MTKRCQISREVLSQLPSDLHRLVAEECFIRTGQWEIAGSSHEVTATVSTIAETDQTGFAATSSAACQEQQSL